MSVGIAISSLTEQADSSIFEGSRKIGGREGVTLEVEKSTCETLDTIEDFG